MDDLNDVDVSPVFKSSSLAVPSPTASHVACLAGSRFQIRCLTTFETLRSIPLPTSHDTKSSRIAWSPPVSQNDSGKRTPTRRTSTRRVHSNRVLISDDETTRVYDLRDDRWSAIISNGSGGMGKTIHVGFGASEDEVFVWSDFAACLKIWCLKTGRAVEIRDPKFSGKEGRGWGFRPVEGPDRASVLAVLCRASGVDVLLLLATETYKLLSRVELPTSDVANLKWSRDGRWLAIWDAASTGYNLHIYTADGHLYRTITREPSEDMDAWGIEGLGIKSVEWLPGNERLAVGGWDRRVRILSARTFAPMVYLDHTPSIHVPTAPVYTEHVDGQGNRSYALTPQPVMPPKAPLEKNETGLMKQGISILAFNCDGTSCVTRDDSTPSTVWIWDLKSLKPRTILIQFAPVKSLQWHPYDPSRLLIQTIHDSPTVYLYTSSSLSSSISSSSISSIHQQPPTILDLSSQLTKPASSLPMKHTTQWLSSTSDKKPVFTVAHSQSYILVWPVGKDQILRFEREDEDQSDDSLYEILTGRTPVVRTRDVDDRDMDVDGEGDLSAELSLVGDRSMLSLGSGSGLDDTFRAKKGGAIGRGGRRSARGREVDGMGDGDGSGVLGESGIDEMF